MGSTISTNKKIDSIITDLGFTKENLTNELQVVYNKYKKLQDDNNHLENINNKYNRIILDKNKQIIELEKSITNHENQLKNHKNKLLQLENDYNKLLTSKTNDLETMQLLINKEKQLNIEINNKYQVSKKNESIFKDHNNYLLKINSKMLVNSKMLKTNDNKPNSIKPDGGNLINKQYTYLIDHVINNLDYHIKQIIGNQEFNVWIPDHYDKNICEKTIIYILSILSK